MSDKKLDFVPIRFNPREQEKLRRALDPERQTGTQLKEIIFQAIAGKAESRLKETATAAEGMRSQEWMDRMTSILSILVDRIEEQDAIIRSVAADAARTKLVVENIQNYLASDDG